MDSLLQTLLRAPSVPSPLLLEGAAHGAAQASLAKALLCEARQPTGEACDRCGGCRKVASENHPDWLRTTGDCKMEELLRLLGQLRQRPFLAPLKVFSILSADDLSIQTQNALLKTLEEPSASWVILLGADTRFRLLPTLRSRCLLIRLEQTRSEEDIDEKIHALFELLQQPLPSEVELHEKLEVHLKDREAAGRLFAGLLRLASKELYPGLWGRLAPQLEQRLMDLQRNRNPRLLWDSAWTAALREHDEELREMA